MTIVPVRNTDFSVSYSDPMGSIREAACLTM